MNADDYHNILSEEFPSPIRQNAQPLPPLPEEPLVHDDHNIDPAIRDEPVYPGSSDLPPIDESIIRDVTPVPESTDLEHRISLHELDENASPGPSNHEEGVEGNPSAPAQAKKRRGHYKHLQLNAQERKERQRLQNREAAQRSRTNKAKDLGQMELDNIKTEQEVVALRARLAELQASRNGATSDTPAPTIVATTTSEHAGLTIDAAYHGRLKQELRTSREELLLAEMELSRLAGQSLTQGWGKRNQLLDRLADLSYLQAESSALESVLASIKKERDDIKVQTENISREVDSRKTYVPPQIAISEDLPSTMDGNAEDISGWVDAAVRDWHESGDIEVHGDLDPSLNGVLSGSGMDIDE